MTLESASQALLIIISSLLGLFLIVFIVVLIKLYQVLRTLKHITDKAARLADSAEAVGNFVKQSAGPVALMNLIANIIEGVTSKKRRGESRRHGKADK